MYETGWDTGSSVTYEQQRETERDVAKTKAQNEFYMFIKLFQKGNTFIYRFQLKFVLSHVTRDQLTKHFLLGQNWIEVSLTDLHRYSDTLASQVREQPAALLGLVCTEPNSLSYKNTQCRTDLLQFEAAARTCAAEFSNLQVEDIQPIQIILVSDDRSLSIRDVQVQTLPQHF